MKSKLTRVTLVTLLAAFAVAPHAVAAPPTESSSETLTLQFVGTATGAAWDALSPAIVAEIENLAHEGTLKLKNLNDFGCFEIDLVDPSSDVTIGTGVDCLSPTPVGPAGNETDAIEVEAFSFFILPGGSFVSNGLTSVRAFIPGVGDGGGFTHLTGSLPDGDNIIGATGQFAEKGATRVSGAVDLSQLGSGIISFNCLWIAEIEILNN